MKNVLVLSVNFPPTGGVGVVRTLKFTKYLPEFNWRPIVVTPQAGTKHIHDESLSVEVPEKALVYRPAFRTLQDRLPKILVKLLRPIERRTNFPDKYVQWNKAAFKCIEHEIIPTNKIDLIYTNTGPYSTILLAHALKKKFQIPTFIDFEDPFSFNQYALLDQKKARMKKACQIEKRVFREVDHINNVTNIWKQKYDRLYPEIQSRSSAIHNGYDEDDFTDLGPKYKHNIFTIGYNGTFSRLVPLKPLIKAIITIHQRHHIPMRLSIATPIKREKLASRYAYLFQHNLIHYKGFLPHKESLKNVWRSDISALILNDIEMTEGMIPAKTYEYLRIANPILLLHREKSFLAQIIVKAKAGITANINAPDDIVHALLKLYEQWRDNFQAHRPDWDQIRKYEYKKLTQQMVNIFNDLV